MYSTLQVAKDNHAALKTFMNLYPEFAKHDLYLTGESYGGIYIPTLSNLVMEDSSMNLKVFYSDFFTIVFLLFIFDQVLNFAGNCCR